MINPKVRKMMAMGMSKKDAERFVAERAEMDRISRQVKATIPTFYSETLKQYVTVPE